MNNNVTLNEQSMTDAAQKIKNAADEIRTLLDSVKAEVTAIDSVWQDKNATVYMERFNELAPRFASFYASAHQLGSFLDGVVRAYRENVSNPTATAVNSDR